MMEFLFVIVDEYGGLAEKYGVVSIVKNQFLKSTGK